MPKLEFLYIPDPNNDLSFAGSLLVYLVYAPLVLAIIGIRIKIAVDLGWSDLSITGCASLIFFPLEIAFVFGFILPIAPIFISHRQEVKRGRSPEALIMLIWS